VSEKKFAIGQCLCGNIKYTVSAAPVRMGQCHCTDCQRSTGTGHSSIAFFKKDDVTIQGEANSYDSITDTGSTLTRYFCSTCGSRLFGRTTSVQDVISISVGTMDDSSWFNPNAIVYNKRKQHWDFMDESVLAFEEMP